MICWQKSEEAASILARSVRRDRGNEDLRFWHGVALYALGEAGEAKRAWEEALEIAPQHKLAAQLLCVFQDAGQPAETPA